jgi:hypothetical protein
MYCLLSLHVWEINGNSVEEETIRPIQAFATLFMWLKLISFMRIFPSTQYMIKVIMTVLYDMRYFLIILAMVVFGFGEAFQSISNGNPEDEKFIGGIHFWDSWLFSYLMMFAAFDPAMFGSVAVELVNTLMFI